MFLSPLEFCIYHLKLGIKKGNEIAMEMLTSKTPEELKIIEDAYKKDTGKDLKTDITKAFSGAVGKNLLNLFTTQRISNPKPNKNECQKFANQLINTEVKNWTEDENLFKTIFIQRSPEELILIARYYLKNTGNNLIDIIEKKAKGKNQSLLKEILYNNIMPHELFAEKIYLAIKGAGTNEENLSRALVSRCELDMAAMRDIYQTKYKVTMKDDIIDDTSGSYQKICIYLSEK
jgi:annexin A7/11